MVAKKYITKRKSMEDYEKDLHGEIKILYEDIPPRIYHYTSTSGVIGIISKSEIWFTNILYMNDASEIKYASDKINSLIEEYKKRYSEEYTENIVDILSDIQFSLTFLEETSNYYISCFCEENDLLSQWRAYAGNGSGFSVGFSTEKMYNEGKLETNKTAIRRVIYDKAKQEEIVFNVLSTFLKLISRNSVVENSFDKIRMSTIEILNQCMCCFKHPAFKEEKEYRLIYFTGDEDLSRAKLREGHIGIVPFLEMTASEITSPRATKLPIQSIKHGPSLHPDLSEKSLSILKNNHGYNNVTINGSKAPLRV